MFLMFRKIIKESNARGWSLQQEKEEFFLSKFDELLNDDEYRIYLKERNNQIEITRTEKLKHNTKTNTTKTMAVKEEHKHVKKAKELCQLYAQKKGILLHT